MRIWVLAVSIATRTILSSWEKDGVEKNKVENKKNIKQKIICFTGFLPPGLKFP